MADIPDFSMSGSRTECSIHYNNFIALKIFEIKKRKYHLQLLLFMLDSSTQI